MQSKRINNTKSVLIILTFIVSLLFILPNDYKHLIPQGDKILNTFTIALLALSYFVFFPTIIKYIKRNILFSVPFVIALTASLLNDGNVEMALYKILCMLIIYFIGASFKEYKCSFIKIAELIMFTILAINFCVAFIHGQPITFSATGGRIYFIFEGEVSKLLIGEMLLFFVGAKMGIVKYKLLHYLVFAMSLWFLTFSSTGFFSSLIMFIFMLFVSKRKWSKNIFKLSILYVIILLIVNILTIFDFFSPILAKLFNKSTTLSGRTDIWKAALGIIREHPLIGIGEYSSNLFMELTGVKGATHAHNQIIQILLNSGLIGFSVYFYYAAKLTKITRRVATSQLAAYYVIYLLTIITMCITGLPFNNFFISTVLIVVNILKTGDSLDDSYQVQEKEKIDNSDSHHAFYSTNDLKKGIIL